MVLLLVSVFPLAFNVQPVKAAGGTIIIQADGTVWPPGAHITNVNGANVYYLFWDNITDSIVVERDNIVLNGAGFVLEGTGTGSGVTLTGRSNVTVKTIKIRNFQTGINLTSSSGNKLYANKITNTTHGILLYSSSGNSISANTITNSTDDGIDLSGSSSNTISANTITNSTDDGIDIHDLSNSNSISSNTIYHNGFGIYLSSFSSGNSIFGNTIANNLYGIYISGTSGGNFVFRNNFIDNTIQADIYSVNAWDDGYPSGGNYWSNYNGVDLFKGAGQNVAGCDEIGDTAYTVAASNIDHYPLLNPYTALTNTTSLVVRGSNNGIYYRTYSATTDSWTGWNALPGTTIDSPAAVLCNNELHFVVRGGGGNTLYHGYVNLYNGVFSGWTLISGSTPSTPTLTSNGTHLCLAVHGSDNRIYYRVYNFNPRSWGSWSAVPTGTTTTSPAAAMLGNNLHIAVRGSTGTNLYHIIIKPGSGVIRNWISIAGSTPSKPVLTADQTANTLYLAVRGNDNKIYWKSYSGAQDTWASWNVVSTGTTGDAPAATVMGSKLRFVIRSMAGTTLNTGYVNLATSTFSGWTQLSGSTPSAPTLTS